MDTGDDALLAERLRAIARADARMMAWLRAGRLLGLRDWCIGAGAVRNMVWDALEGHAQPSHPADVDLVYHDPQCLDAAQDQRLQARLLAAAPDTPWEVMNQARVHTWFAAHFGHPVEPLRSLSEAVASWPETCTAVGLCLGQDEQIEVLAPLGLGDLFARIVRRNPRRVSLETYRQRVADKRYASRWAGVRVIAA